MKKVDQKRINQKLQELQTTFSLSNDDVKNLKQWLSTEHGYKYSKVPWNSPIAIAACSMAFAGLFIVTTLVYIVSQDPENLQLTPPVPTPVAPTPPEPHKHEEIKNVDTSNLPKRIYRYGGSTSWAPVVCGGEGIDKFIEERTGLQLKASQGGTAEAHQVADKTLDFGIVSQDRTTFIEEQGGKNIQLEQIPVARDAIAFAVNPSLSSSIQGLTRAQLKNIYGVNDQITWGSVLGSEDSTPVVPFSRPPEDSGTVRHILSWLELKNLGNQVKRVQTTTGKNSGIYRAANASGGIYFATATEIFGQETIKPIQVGETETDWFLPYTRKDFAPNEECKKNLETPSPTTLNSNYPHNLIRNIYILIRVDNSDAERAGRAYAAMLRSRQGQEFLQKIGYFPLDRSQ